MAGRMKRRGASGVGEADRAHLGRRVSIRPEHARRACRAVQRVLEVTVEIVMFEGRCDEKDRVQQDTNERQHLSARNEESARHWFDDTPLHQARQLAADLGQ